LKAEGKDWAIDCDCAWGPSFNDIAAYNNCNANTRQAASLGSSYTNDIGMDANTFFTGSQGFQVKEIEMFEIKD
jgi:hypothetical protein